AAILVGSALAVPTSRRVPMTAMPQLVALFNGVGGGAAAIVAFLELPHAGGGFPLVAAMFTIVVGSISFSGSVVTFLKLQEVMTRLMAQAMGRPLTSTLFGALRGGSTAGSAGPGTDRPVRSASPDDVAILLNYAGRVVVVPGYGLAVAQAQHTVRELADLLAE